MAAPIRVGILHDMSEGVDDEMADKIAGKYARSLGDGFLQDVAIWKNKPRIGNPLLCEEDARSTSCVSGTSSSTSPRPTSSRT